MGFRRLTVKAALLLAAAAAIIGCVPVEKAAPPVGTFAVETAGSSRLQLERGRDLYVTKCARCHRPERVTRYSPGRWERILPKMVRKTKLNAPDADAVGAYVRAVLAGRS